MMISRNKKIALFVAALVLAFAVGRYTASEKVRIEEAGTQNTVTDTKKDVNKKKKTVTVEVEKIDGTKERTTTVTEDTEAITDTRRVSDNANTKVTEKEVGGNDKVTVSALAGMDFRNSTQVYGASVSKPLLGPINMGLWGLTNGNVGVSLGIEF